MSKTGSRTPAASASTPSQSSSSDFIRAGAGRCVACGLCLPHCPTYKKTKSELESPRGRISLMLALAKGDLEATPKLESHLSLCLLCRACEAVCPAGVPFGDTMDATRAQIVADRRPSFWCRVGLRTAVLLTRPRWTATMAKTLRFYQRSGLQAALRRMGLLRLLNLDEADAGLPSLGSYVPLAAQYLAEGKRRGAVALFTGCIARIADMETLHSSVRVLTRLGYDVHVPPGQTCCGALHRHEGNASTADALMRVNIEAFREYDIETIITTASGCAATLVEYGDDPGKRFAINVRDINTFLTDIEWPSEAVLRPLNARIAVHDPCTLVNVLRARQAPYTLLRRIPNADVAGLPGNNQCCGGAGAYHLKHKEMARQLRDDKTAGVRAATPQIVATSNIGCAMHMASGLRKSGITVEIVHPVTLIARQLS